MNSLAPPPQPDYFVGPDDDFEDSPYCECGEDPYEEEAASNVCSACGKPLS